MSSNVAQDKVASLRDDAEGITAGLFEAHSIIDSLTGLTKNVSETPPVTDSIIGELALALQNNRALADYLVKRLAELKAKF